MWCRARRWFRGYRSRRSWAKGRFRGCRLGARRLARCLAGGELDASLEASVFLGKVILCVEAGGGVVARNAVGTGQVFFLRGDDEVAVLLLQVGGRLV